MLAVTAVERSRQAGRARGGRKSKSASMRARSCVPCRGRRRRAPRCAPRAEVQLRLAHDGLRVLRASRRDVDVVAVDVMSTAPSTGARPARLLDEAVRAAARADARVWIRRARRRRVRVCLDDLVRDARERPGKRVSRRGGSSRRSPPRPRVAAGIRRNTGVRRHSTPFRPHWSRLRGSCPAGLLRAEDGLGEPQNGPVSELNGDRDVSASRVCGRQSGRDCAPHAGVCHSSTFGTVIVAPTAARRASCRCALRRKRFMCFR